MSDALAVNHDFRENVSVLERVMLDLPQVEIQPTHYFAKGLYAREIFISKGTLLTGKIHKHEHLNIISKGVIDVMTEEGPVRITAPATIVSRPNTKRIGYAVEDTVWTTIHATKQTELDKLEEDLILTDYQDALPAFTASPQIEEV